MEAQASTPVMDVSAPPSPPKTHQPALAIEPAASKASEKPKPAPEHKAEAKTEKKATVQSKVQQPKQNNGIGMAIFATVVIVLGLGAIAAYAYIKQTS